MKVSGICVSVCLLLVSFGRQTGAASHGGRMSETLGDLTFECREGWQIYQGNCYLHVEKQMTFADAKETCNSVSADLWYGEVDYFDFMETFAGPDSHIWTSIYKHSDGQWKKDGEIINLQTLPYWTNYEPNANEGPSRDCTVRYGAGLHTDTCDRTRDVVCVYPACLQGYMRCATDKKCVHRERDLCDGISDCSDRSDEADCPDKCQYHMYVEDERMDITSQQINMNMDCIYTLEAHIGERILLEIPSMNLLDNAGFLEAWSYDLVSGESSLERRLTGQVTRQNVYSDKHILQLRLYRNGLAGSSITAQTFRATTAIQQLFEGTREMTAQTNYASLDIPFSNTNLRPDSYRLQWVIIAPDRQVISYNLVSTDTSRHLENIPFSYVDGDGSSFRQMEANTYYTTGTNRLQVKLMVDPGMDTHMYVQYKTGCTLAIQATDGVIESPGHSRDAIPNDLTCRWNLTAGQLRNPDRGMTIKFSQIDLASDPRSPHYADVLQVFTDGNTTSESGPVVDSIISAPGGQITVDFQSDSYLQSNGFSAYFGTDCAALSLSAVTAISPSTTYSRETVQLSCPTGYEFNRERYNMVSQLDIMCYRDAWYDVNEDEVIVPECQIKICGIPPAIPNGFILNSTNVVYEAIATYECNPGFTRMGAADVECNEFGNWDPRPTCRSDSCDVLPANLITNGGFNVTEGNDFLAMQTTSVDYDTVIRFYCNDGYELIGLPISHCDQSTSSGWTHGNSPPTCQELKCPLPMLENAVYDGGVTEVQYQGRKTVRCNSGYRVDTDTGFVTSMTITCQANQTFDQTVTCVDIDECVRGSVSCSGSVCRNTIGSYVCDCWSGYQKINPNSCTDINECLDDDTCDHQCSNTPLGSFTCSCYAGYEMFTEDGKHGFYINNPGPGYIINYTCVPVACPVLVPPDNGMYLTNTAGKLFHSGNVVTLQCDDGYRISGGSLPSIAMTCQNNGAWSNSPSCIPKTCTVPSLSPTNGVYDRLGTIEFGETVTLNCTLSAGVFVERRAKCVAQEAGSGVGLGGDNINACPEVDCGNPTLVSPTGAMFSSPQSMKHLNVGSSFTFGCDNGYDVVGAGEDPDNTRLVTCKANGNWAFGTLTCDGKKCPDPGTPGDASQVVQSYEIGQQLAYSCDRNGFKALHNGVDRNFTCQLVNNQAVWSNSLSKTNLPVCTDMTPPEILGCPTSPLEYYPMASITLPTLSATDNAGELEYFGSVSDLRSGDRITTSRIITYTARDFQQLTSTCVVEIRVINIDIDGPSLSCPDYIQIIVEENVTSIDILTTYSNQITSDAESMVASPPTVSPSINKIGQYDRITVTATNDLGLTRSCNFLVTYPALGYCDERAIYQDSNRNTLQFTDDVNGGLTANGTCRTGYTYRDGSTTKLFTCTPSSGWMYDAEDIFCLAYRNPSYDFSLSVKFTLGTYVPPCLDQFDTSLANNLAVFETNVQGLSECAGTSWAITGARYDYGFNSVDTRLRFSLSNLDVPNDQRESCRQQILDNYVNVFSYPSPGTVFCSTADPPNVPVSPSNVAEDTGPALSCGEVSYDLIDSQQYGPICIPCGPGSFYDDATSRCSQCAIDSYTDLANSYACTNCPDGANANAERIDCLGTCPPGYTSTSGMYPCTPCPKDTYWVDSQTCQACPSAGSTLGMQGATTVSACSEPCGPGTFSRTGYMPCESCGNAFFTPLSGQKMCSECPGGETTFNSSINSVADCIAIPADPNDHIMVNVSTNRVGPEDNTNLYLTAPTQVSNLEACADLCLSNPGCQEASYQENPGVKFCFQYNTVVATVPKITDIGIHMGRESNLVCYRSDCNNHGDCALLHHRPHCTCDAGYKGDQCQTFISICDANPCLNGGECMENELFKDYTCNCPDDPTKYIMNTIAGEGRMGTQDEVLEPGGAISVSTQVQCGNACLRNDLCEFAAFVQQFGSPFCYLFGVNPTLEAPDSTITVTAYMQKDRRPGQPVGGDNCGTDTLDACESSHCNEKAMCMDLVQGYQCLCPVSGGLQGQYCDTTADPCSPNPCVHGRCQSFGTVRYECTCDQGYDGINCDNDIDECTEHPNACLNGGTCNDQVNGYSCTCSLFFGNNCENVPDFCENIDCLGDNVCSSSIIDGHTCHCDPRYFQEDPNRDRYCEQIPGSDPCNSNPCQNGTCVPNGWDTYSYTCNCEAGFMGSLCQTSVDDCLNVNCNNGRCIDEHQGHRCECDAGYDGASCQNNINDCSPNPCDPNHGSCDDLVNDFRCDCDPGFTGETCAEDINECLSYPCQHGGTCTEGDNSYTCSCRDGWMGTNCELEVNQCSPGLCNSGKCYSLLDSAFCICGGGTQGQNCEDRRSVCDTLSHFTVCANNGFCRDYGDTAQCVCPKVDNQDDCYFEDAIEDTGVSDASPLAYLTGTTLESCQSRCRQLETCAGLTFHAAASACVLHTESALQPEPDRGASFSQKTCPSHYSGMSCEYKKNWCSTLNNPCANGGECVEHESGYTCNCKDGFEGPQCDNYVDPCASQPCGNSNLVTCKSLGTEYICQCQQGQVFSRSLCSSSESFVLLVDNLDGMADRPSLGTPFSFSSTAFSIMMRLKVHDFVSGVKLFTLKGSQTIHPESDDALFQLEVQKDGIVVNYGGQQKVLLFGEPQFYDATLYDAEWHFFGIAINSNGDMFCSIDSTAAENMVNIGSELDLTDFNMNIMLGTNVRAEYEDLKVYDIYLDAGQFTSVFGGDLNLATAPRQGWWNWNLPQFSFRMNNQLQSTYAADDSKISQALDCANFQGDWSVVAEHKFLSRSEVLGFTNSYGNLRTDNVGLELKHSIPSVMEWGMYQAIAVGMNPQTERYGECRAKIYVKYNAACPSYVRHDASVIVTSCSGNGGICGLECLNPANSLSAAFPLASPCGALGVYDQRDPWQTLVLPTCTASVSPKYIVTVKQQYQFTVVCSTHVTSLGTVERRLRTKLNASATNWPGICTNPTSSTMTTCSNFMFEYARCTSNTSKMLEVEFSASYSTSTLTRIAPVTEFDLVDVFLSLFLEEGADVLSSIANAVLIPESVEVTRVEGCATGSTLLYNDQGNRICAPCGKGHYVDSATMQCMRCEPGTYQDQTNMYECKQCPADMTNYEYGEVSDTSCVEICSPGKFRSGGTRGDCLNCPRHTYQETAARTYCDYCDLGYKTASVGSDSQELCKVDCPAGEYRTQTQVCEVCPRGTWRSQDYDDCQLCPDGTTTYDDGSLAENRDACKMDICDLGAFWNMTSEECQDCDFGSYQDEMYALQCKPCNGNMTTMFQKSTSQDNCTFYCADGYEVMDATLGTCRACDRGTYKINDGMAKFEGCVQCSANTTDDIARTSAADCFVPMCQAGEIIVNGVCDPCPIDFYSEVDLPYTSTMCEPCSCETCDTFGTMETGTDNATLCFRYCEPGMELVEDECVMCQRGYYKDNAGNSRFDACQLCSDNMMIITDDVGAESIDECVIPKCASGQNISETATGAYECVDCPMDKYQEVEMPQLQHKCVSCPNISNVQQGTEMTGVSAVTECKPVCPGGQQYNNVTQACDLCPIGQFKMPSERFGMCINCLDPLFVTSAEGAESNDECDLRDCGPGTYIDASGVDCLNCSLCSWQDQRRKISCNHCGTNLCTRTIGATSESQCTIRCEAGKEGTTECVPCGDGKFKPDAGYGDCQDCPNGFTSSPNNRTACNLLNCYYGYQYTNANGDEDCEACPVGEFKDAVGNDVMCSPCEPSYTTDGEGQRECALRDCLPGTTLDGEDCVDCAIGFFKSEQGNMSCTQCPANTTTDGEGKMNSDDCNLAICPIGKYRSEALVCLPCQVNQYNPNIGATSCMPCDDGKITLENGATAEDQCVPQCDRGFQYNSTTKMCDQCPVGFYKNTSGNTMNCSKCPELFTTIGKGSQSAAACDQTVCPAGTKTTRTNTEIVCVDCEIGTFNPDTGVDACTPCPGTNTTFRTGRTDASDCFSLCGPGRGSKSGVCVDCAPGEYNDQMENERPNECKLCPPGRKSLKMGATSCEFEDIAYNPDVVVKVDITVVVMYKIELASCSFINTALSPIYRALRNIFQREQSRSFQGNGQFCTQGCGNMLFRLPNNLCSRKRKKRALYDIAVEVVFQNVSNSIQDTGNGNVLVPTKDAIGEILLHNEAEMLPEEIANDGGSYITYTPPNATEVCSPGQVTDGTSCTPCPKGEYWTMSGVCMNCPNDTYQDETGQVSCKDCPFDKFHNSVRQTDATACESYCAKTNYCNGRGVCTSTGRRMASCNCYEDYEGAQCEARKEPQSDQDLILGLSIGGGGGLLLIILAIVGIYRYLNSKDNKERKKRYRRDEREYYTDNMYDNYSHSHGLAPVQSIGYPALGYRPDPSIIDDSPYSAVYKNPAYGDPNKSQNEDTFVWQA